METVLAAMSDDTKSVLRLVGSSASDEGGIEGWSKYFMKRVDPLCAIIHSSAFYIF